MLRTFSVWKFQNHLPGLQLRVSTELGGLGKRRSIRKANIDLFTSRRVARRAAGMNTNYSVYLISVIKSFLG